MVNKLIPMQIPKYWDLIKFAIRQVERIPDTQYNGYFTKLLAALLNDRSQCFIKHNTKDVQALVVTELLEDIVSRDRTLWIRCLYGFSSATPIDWANDIKLIKEFAKSEKCSTIKLNTPFKKVEAHISDIGFTKQFSTYSLEV